MAQPVPTKERIRRQRMMEDLVNQGYMPLGVKGDMPSAAQEGKRRDGVNYARWIRDEEKIRDAGERHYLPNWIGVDAWEDQMEATAPEGAVENATVASIDHASARAAALSSAVIDLVTRSRYPVVNPESIIVAPHSTQRYDRKSGEYVSADSTPRTWLTETLRVEGVRDAANRKFILTGAQNDAPLHKGFWENLQAYAEFLGAEIVVGPFTYTTSWWDESNPSSRTYAKEVADHLCFGQMLIGEEFAFCGEMNIIPTASQPISDLLTYPKNRSAAFPHAKRQLKSVPSTDPSQPAHQVMTTGSVTRPKIVPRKAGVKAIFNHVIGAVIVEFDEIGVPFPRQITAAKDGSFYDLDRRVENGLVTNGHRVRAIVCGDIHRRKIDPINALATFGFDPDKPDVRTSDDMISVLKPEYVVVHDVFDHEARNHHNAGDPGHGYEMHIRGRDSILGEIVQAGEFLEQIASVDHEVVVVESNHDLGLDRYIREGRYRFDPPNIRLGLTLETMMLEHRAAVAQALDSRQPPPKFSLLQSAMSLARVNLDGISWAYDGQSRLIDGIEIGHHGFRGTNGAKGTVQGFARTGRQLSIADKHCAEINEGVYVAGVLQLQMGYNRGPSGWTVSNILHYPDGHRAIVTIRNGKWTPKKLRVRVAARSA